MQKRKVNLDNIFLGISAIATLFVATELVLKTYGMSICSFEGCKMTARYARFGDQSIFAIGFVTFLSLTGLAFLNRALQNPVVNRLINLILVIALASEGFFMGYLAFRIHTLCLICVSIFGFLVSLGIIRLLSRESDIIAGFGALVAVFFLQYLLLPAGIPVNLPLHERLILFYSTDCRHCAELLAELERKNISVAHLQASEYAVFLRNMGVDAVPTLMVNDPLQKSFLTGKDAIERYLDSCTVTRKTASPKSVDGKSRSGKKNTVSKLETGSPVDIFGGNNGLLSLPVQSANDDSMCKQDVVCK